jgi:hypothetical protein
MDLVGMTQENCSAIVEVPNSISYGKNKEKEGAELIAQHPLCAEGWKGHVSDLFNGHKCVGVEDKISRQRVGFYRWVPTQPATESEAV